MARRLDSHAEDSFFVAAQHASKFFVGQSDVHKALEALVAALTDEGIDYAIIGAMALGEYGYRRTTDDIDVLLTTVRPRRLSAGLSRPRLRGEVSRK